MATEPQTTPTSQDSVWSRFASSVYGIARKAVDAGGRAFPGNILVPGSGPIVEATGKIIASGAGAVEKAGAGIKKFTENAAAGVKTGLTLSMVLILGVAALFIFAQARAVRRDLTGG